MSPIGVRVTLKNVTRETEGYRPGNNIYRLVTGSAQPLHQRELIKARTNESLRLASAQPYNRGRADWREENLVARWYSNDERDKPVEIHSSRRGLHSREDAVGWLLKILR